MSDLETKEKLLAAVREEAVRRQRERDDQIAQESRAKELEDIRALHATRGHYDENGEWVGGLMEFIRYFWHVLEPATPLVEGWPLYAICQHLEAVTYGEITRLLINVSPGSTKSMATNVFWPAFEWGPMLLGHFRYLTFSYSARLTERDNGRFRDLIRSPEYHELYGNAVTLDQTGAQKVSNFQTGWKLSSSIGGVGTGERGNRVLLDDPHNVKQAESDTVRQGTVQWFRETMSNRLNDMETDAIVIIMQRVHDEDISGSILTLGLPYCHLMVPMEYDPDRQCDDVGNPVENDIGWFDPRVDTDDPELGAGTLAWPERFSPQTVERIKLEIGPWAWASQYQQSPRPRGGGILQRDWWKVWESPDGKFPVFDYLVASVDSAFTEKEENDPSAMTVWGIFRNDEGNPRAMLVHAWRKRLRFHGPTVDLRKNESQQSYRMRAMKDWGLVEWVADTCRRFKVDRLLVEAKASGISAAQELRRLHGREGWAIELVTPKGDKVARALAVQPSFSQGMIYAPVRDWAEMVIDEAESFPKGKHDDLVDTVTQAIKHLRDSGLLRSDEEVRFEDNERVRQRSKSRPLYPV